MTVTEEVAALKERQHAVWATGDYAQVARLIAEVGELCGDRAGIDADKDVLDLPPGPRVTAAELVRVCRPGGRIVMCNWTPDGMVGEGFKLMARYSPRPPSWVSPPALWGHGPHVRAIFAETSATIPSLERRIVRVP